MTLSGSIFSLPRELEPCLLLAYVIVVLFGARVMEHLARLHFSRADRHAREGFEYDREQDLFRCHQGARLALHVLDERAGVGVYRAPASRCASCAHKSRCTPHATSRHLYRSLATWAETDVGRFHRYFSVVMFASSSVVSSAVLIEWSGQPGMGPFMLALAVSVTLLRSDLRRLPNASLSTREDR